MLEELRQKNEILEHHEHELRERVRIATEQMTALYEVNKEIGANLDLTSVHFYPRAGEVDRALAALEVYRSEKPLIVEETFPLACSIEELDAFIAGSRAWTAGYVGFYWGETIEELELKKNDLAAAMTREWLLYFRDRMKKSRLSGRP